jgi:hypothetical protein
VDVETIEERPHARPVLFVVGEQVVAFVQFEEKEEVKRVEGEMNRKS